MTKPGIYKHYKGGTYRVLFTARQSTNGPSEGRVEVIYISLKYGHLNARDEEQFHEQVDADPAQGFIPGAKVPRFSFSHDQLADADAAALYDDLHATFTGRKPAP